MSITSGNTVCDVLQSACADIGIVWRDVPSDGRWHRTDVEDDPRGHGDGSIKLFADGAGGIVCNWKTGEKKLFFATNGSVTDAERDERERRKSEAIREAEQEAARRHSEASAKARALWREARPATQDHPYLIRKKVSPVSTLKEISQDAAAKILGYEPQGGDEKLTGRLLLAPVKVGDRISTVEMIDESGRKAAVAGGQKRGGYWAAQSLPTEGRGVGLTILIGEGVATVLSAKEATGHHAIAALSCHNLSPVATAMRERYPHATIIILADLGNGQRHAEEAARSVNGLLALPDFGSSQPDGATDFNDVAVHFGIEVVRRLIENATPPTVLSTSNNDERQIYDSEHWSEPEAILDELPPVEAFSEELLPSVFRPLVQDMAERMQVPMDYPAVALVLCLAGVVNRRATIQPKAADTGWNVVPNLWGGIIAPPGFLKSPVIQAVTAPLRKIQAEWRREHDEAAAEYDNQQEEYDLRCAAWKEQYKARVKQGKTPPVRPIDEAKAPTLRRLIVNDATFEALHEIMVENPAGVLFIRDELTGWWAQLDRPGREGDRAFFLQAWNGDTGHDTDRITRGSLFAEACCLSMLGGIQPGRLRSYLVDALRDGPSNDGLIQRFQLLVWPDTAETWEYVDRLPALECLEVVEQVFRKLVKLDPASAKRFRFEPDAQQLFVAFIKELESKVRGDSLHPALISHLSKYRSLMPSLALLFELAECAVNSDTPVVIEPTSVGAVSLDHAKKAAAWCAYLESHARRVYSCIVTPPLRAARELAARISKRNVGGKDGFFSCREVYLKGWSGLDTPDAVKSAAQVLQDAGWVRAVAAESRPHGGRPADRYQINLRVWQ